MLRVLARPGAGRNCPAAKVTISGTARVSLRTWTARGHDRLQERGGGCRPFEGGARPGGAEAGLYSPRGSPNLKVSALTGVATRSVRNHPPSENG